MKQLNGIRETPNKNVVMSHEDAHDGVEVRMDVRFQKGREPFIFLQVYPRDGGYQEWQLLPGSLEWQIRCDACREYVKPELLHAACTPGGHG